MLVNATSESWWMPLLLEWEEEIDLSCVCVSETAFFEIIIIIIIINIVFVVVVLMLQNRQVVVTSFACCWYSGGIPSRYGIKPEQPIWYYQWKIAQPASMRAPSPPGSCYSCSHPGPPWHRAILQGILIQSIILVHQPAPTVHQHNPSPQSPHFVSLTR